MPLEHCLCGRVADHTCYKCKDVICDTCYDNHFYMCLLCYKVYNAYQLQRLKEQLKDPKFDWGHTIEII